MAAGTNFSSSDAYLGIELPALPLNGAYHLLAVGSVRQQLPDLSGYRAQLYLQARESPDAYSTELGPIVHVEANMSYASAWQAGTVWKASGYQVADTASSYPEHRIVDLGYSAPRLVLADEELADNELTKELPIAVRPFVWLAIWEHAGSQLLIPSFELLRSLYYCGGPWLTAFFFARIPLEHLGRLIAGPSASNSFGVHMCVAAQSLSPSEAQIVAALLSDPAYAAIIHHSHLSLALQWMHGNDNALFNANVVLGRRAILRAQGKSFVRAKHSAFWVATLYKTAQCFPFRHILFHPLRMRSLRTRSTSPMVQPMTDVLATLGIANRKKTTGNYHIRPLADDQSVIPIRYGFPWAIAKSRRGAPHFLEEQMCLPWEQRAGSNRRFNRPVKEPFISLEKQFISKGWQVRRLIINNPDSRYGEGWSVCRYSDFLPLLGETYKHFLLRFAITEICRADYCCYLVYSYQQQICVIIYHPNLQPLKDEELQMLLDTLAREIRQTAGRRTLYPPIWKRKLKPIRIEQLSLKAPSFILYLECERLLNLRYSTSNS
ncbi:hypothetical protein [Hymenobacter wooponensis]|uniref:Uncharacterized protein n=1 Tax=Hymenobacter wooponensis TaxID=1525360 RepID=A0A4Z0MAY4_9BACT|nr:hypothetical protein [Hymenobacter wooponensis]TGD76913.1 hypothetical protein EU557_24950 [Hymenobacter wooponensis]